MSEKRGRWEKGITKREEEWENALASCMVADMLGNLCEDADAIYLRFSQLKHRHPERMDIIGPGMKAAESMRRELTEALERVRQAQIALIAWRNKYLPSPNGSAEELDK